MSGAAPYIDILHHCEAPVHLLLPPQAARVLGAERRPALRVAAPIPAALRQPALLLQPPAAPGAGGQVRAGGHRVPPPRALLQGGRSLRQPQRADPPRLHGEGDLQPDACDPRPGDGVPPGLHLLHLALLQRRAPRRPGPGSAAHDGRGAAGFDGGAFVISNCFY